VPQAVVQIAPPVSDPVPPAVGVDLRVVSVTRHLLGGFATVRVAARCALATQFYVNVEARQAEAGASRTGFGETSQDCGPTERLFPVLVRGVRVG